MKKVYCNNTIIEKSNFSIIDYFVVQNRLLKISNFDLVHTFASENRGFSFCHLLFMLNANEKDNTQIIKLNIDCLQNKYEKVDNIVIK